MEEKLEPIKADELSPAGQQPKRGNVALDVEKANVFV